MIKKTMSYRDNKISTKRTKISSKQTKTPPIQIKAANKPFNKISDTNISPKQIKVPDKLFNKTPNTNVSLKNSCKEIKLPPKQIKVLNKLNTDVSIKNSYKETKLPPKQIKVPNKKSNTGVSIKNSYERNGILPIKNQSPIEVPCEEKLEEKEKSRMNNDENLRYTGKFRLFCRLDPRYKESMELANMLNDIYDKTLETFGFTETESPIS
jgi:hypothetical protein